MWSALKPSDFFEQGLERAPGYLVCLGDLAHRLAVVARAQLAAVPGQGQRDQCPLVALPLRHERIGDPLAPLLDAVLQQTRRGLIRRCRILACRGNLGAVGFGFLACACQPGRRFVRLAFRLTPRRDFLAVAGRVKAQRHGDLAIRARHVGYRAAEALASLARFVLLRRRPPGRLLP